MLRGCDQGDTTGYQSRDRDPLNWVLMFGGIPSVENVLSLQA